MNKKEQKIIIVGGGISGLIAATVLEKEGYEPVIFERSSEVGGRLKTTVVEGYQLDHGFQVLLEEYPMVKRYLDMDKLAVQKFLPGAIIYKNKQAKTFGDPLRTFSFLFPTLFSGIGTFKDKRLILKLNRHLKKQSVENIFEQPEQTTLQFLNEFGFSTAILNDFFKPFFSGIFLEDALETSSRMFAFIYKMFGKGLAVLPKQGISAVAKQLAERLTVTKIKYNINVKQVKDYTIVLENEEEIKANAIIVATEASSLIHNLKNQSTNWKSCDNLYFEIPPKQFTKPLIGLLTHNGLVNNIFCHNTLKTASKGAKDLLSVTVIKSHDLSEPALIKAVQTELAEQCNITEAKFIKRFVIPQALPNITDVKYSIDPTETQLTSSIFLAGDYLVNGSLNAAMLSGEAAAYGAIKMLEGKLTDH